MTPHVKLKVTQSEKLALINTIHQLFVLIPDPTFQEYYFTCKTTSRLRKELEYSLQMTMPLTKKTTIKIPIEEWGVLEALHSVGCNQAKEWYFNEVGGIILQKINQLVDNFLINKKFNYD